MELSTDIGAQFELSVNLGADNVQLAVDQATDFTKQMPAGSLLALEIGNEPDIFVKNGLRPPTYDFQDYLQDFDTWAEHVTPAAKGVKLAGPSAGGFFFGTGAATYLANAQTFLSDESSVLSMYTQHLYAASPADNPTPTLLLSPAAATYGPSLFAPAVAAAQSHGIPFRMDEIGPVSDGGMSGVSNTFAAALWAADILFNYANVGAAGVNIDASGGNPNDPFSFSTTTSNGVTTYTLNWVSPIYSGLLFFQAALGDGARMLPVTLETPANLTAWATAPVGRNPRLALINKDEAQSGNVSITMPGYSEASVVRLTAPSYTSTSGVTFAGQTMDGSATGNLRGTKTEVIIEGSDGVFEVPMPITSAALVVFTN